MGPTQSFELSIHSKFQPLRSRTVNLRDSDNGNLEKWRSSNSPFPQQQSKQEMDISTSQKLTLGYAALVGVGGIMGYVKSRSHISAIAGGLSASALYYVYTELPNRPGFASSLGLG
ncbi:FATTY ACID EXPORT 7-like protein, partial [Drosera capensis]